MKLNNKKVISAIVLGMAILPLLAAAQGTGITGAVQTPNVGFTFTQLVKVLNTVVSWIFTVFLIVAVIFVIIAAFSYLTSGGDPEKIKTASKQLVFAAVAIAVALLSVSIRFIVQDLLGITIK